MRLRLFFLFLLLATVTSAETIRVATYNVSLGRKGPGLLLKDILEGDAQIAALVTVIQTERPDILVMQEFDHDDFGLALSAFRDVLSAGPDGIEYPYWFAPAGNEGRPSFIDLDGDGRENEWADALGFGKFPGSEGMALLSRLPIRTEDIHTFAHMLWRDVPDADFPVTASGEAFLSPEVLDILPMSYRSHWDVPIDIGEQVIHILAAHTAPPVFDGPENLNGLRNAAEIAFWVQYLNRNEFADDLGRMAVLTAPFVLAGDYNSDPFDGEGDKDAIGALLTHRLIDDPKPVSLGAAISSGTTNMSHIGDPALDTVDWGDEIGNMRVDYALPSADLRIEGAAVVWPEEDDPFFEIVEDASHHRMVWVEIDVSEIVSEQ